MERCLDLSRDCDVTGLDPVHCLWQLYASGGHGAREVWKEMEAPKVYSPPHALVLPDEGGWDPWLKLVPLSHDPSVPPAAVLAEYSTQTISDYPVLMASASTECAIMGRGAWGLEGQHTVECSREMYLRDSSTGCSCLLV